MEEDFIRNRITSLRMGKNISEYQMSLELGMNKGYIQSISSGRAMPSMKQFLEICEYFKISPTEFFQPVSSPATFSKQNTPPLIKKAVDIMERLNDEDILAVISILKQLEKAHQL